MKIFIFGAGASKGALSGLTVHDKYIPPLTNDLFDPRYSEYARQVGIFDTSMNRLRDKIAQHVYLEDWLTNEWEKISTLKEVGTRDAQKGFLAQVGFYIWLTLLNVSKWTYENQFQSREINGYNTLMSKIYEKDEPFGLINFNYDLMLDYAYKDIFKKTFHSIDDYLNNNYVKPHGSVNWLLSKRPDDRNIDVAHEHNMDTKTRLDTAINLMFRDSPIPITGLVVKEPDHRDLYIIDNLLRAFNNQYFYPLIFLPLTSKAYSSISGFEDKIIAKGKELISQANEIYLIGYRANDEIIKELLSKAKAGTRIYIVGVGSAKEIMTSVLKLNPNLIQGSIYHQGFYHFAYNEFT